MSAATGQHTESRRTTATRDALYDAAATLFVERGYESSTMADIAERAGTSRRTAFNYFPSKGDFPMLWVRKMADHAVEVLADARDEEDAADRVRTYFRFISSPMEVEPELTRQMMLGWTAAVGPIRYESQLLADLRRLLEEGQRQGQIRAEVDVAEAARTMSDIYMGVVFRWVREQHHSPTLSAAVGGGVELVLAGLVARRAQ